MKREGIYCCTSWNEWPLADNKDLREKCLIIDSIIRSGITLIEIFHPKDRITIEFQMINSLWIFVKIFKNLFNFPPDIPYAYAWLERKLDMHTD